METSVFLASGMGGRQEESFYSRMRREIEEIVGELDFAAMTSSSRRTGGQKLITKFQIQSIEDFSATLAPPPVKRKVVSNPMPPRLVTRASASSIETSKPSPRTSVKTVTPRSITQQQEPPVKERRQNTFIRVQDISDPVSSTV